MIAQTRRWVQSDRRGAQKGLPIAFYVHVEHTGSIRAARLSAVYPVSESRSGDQVLLKSGRSRQVSGVRGWSNATARRSRQRRDHHDI